MVYLGEDRREIIDPMKRERGKNDREGLWRKRKGGCIENWYNSASMSW